MMQRMFGGSKVSMPIAVPTAGLDLSEFMAKGASVPKPYQLIGCVNHYGMVIGGHYTACARHGDVWYGFDDDDVRTLGDDVIFPPNGNSASYMLLFRQGTAGKLG
jgi:ubiquitin C-terminal hydrolase